MHRLCALAVCLLVPACRISVPDGVLPCASERDCPVTWACAQGTCVQAVQTSRSAPSPDVSVTDAGMFEVHDASMADASVPAPPPRDASVPSKIDAALSGKDASRDAGQHDDADDAGSGKCTTSCLDASTAPACHEDFGAQCGGLCDTSGTIECDGSCSKPDPVDYADECGHCGGRVQCDGSCDIPDPPRFGELCSDLVSRVGCSGACECVRQCLGGQLVPCARLCPILCRDGFCELP